MTIHHLCGILCPKVGGGHRKCSLKEALDAVGENADDKAGGQHTAHNGGHGLFQAHVQEGGNNKNGESKLAGKSFFDTDNDFKINNFFDFCTRYLKKEPKEKGQAPAMIVFCAFEQIPMVIEQGKKHGLLKSYPLVFIKNYSAQVLKANMKIVGATEYAVVLYRDKLPKFNNDGHMIFNWFEWKRDNKSYPKIHPTQKPIALLKQQKLQQQRKVQQKLQQKQLKKKKQRKLLKKLFKVKK